MILIRIFINIYFIFIAIGTTQANATIWYVDNSAVGTNSGQSWQNAWTSFDKIVWGTGGVKAGDIIYISGGITSKVYNEKLDIKASGSPGAPITILAGQDTNHNGQIIISNPSGSGISIYNQSHVTINGEVNGKQNIRITGCYGNGIDIAGVVHHNKISYLEIDNNGHSGGINQDGITANFSEMSEYPVLEISYCKIHNNWQDQIHIVGVRGPNVYGRVLIHDNEIYELQDDGIETSIRGMDIFNNVMHTLSSGKGIGHPDGIVIMAGYGRIWNNTVYNLQNNINLTNAYIYPNIYSTTPIGECCIRIYNNLVYQTVPGSANNYGRGLELSVQGSITALSDVIIANNTFVGLPAWGANLYFGSLGSGSLDKIFFLNNIIHNCNKNGGTQAMGFGYSNDWSVGSYGSGADVIVDYNIVSAGPQGSTQVTYKGTIYDYNTWKTKFGVQSHIIGNNDPLLNTFYMPSFASPAVNKGIDLSSHYSIDKSGITRPQGPAWDIGAYEYVEKTDTITPPSNFRILK